jgi:ABC-type cobalt transport system substrate-binding protein
VEECPAFCGDCYAPITQVHENGIGPVDFFRRTGYFLKQLDPDNDLGLRESKLFVIILNTNLGAANLQQSTAFQADLEWLSSQGSSGVYLLGHHPSVMRNPALVPERYNSLVMGRFAGHVHWAESTDEMLFTQVSSISQAGETSFTTFVIRSGETQSGGFQVDAQLGRDVVTYVGGAGDTAEARLWEVAPGPEAAADQILNASDGEGASFTLSLPLIVILLGAVLLMVSVGGTVHKRKPDSKIPEVSIYGGSASSSNSTMTEENPAQPSSV